MPACYFMTGIHHKKTPSVGNFVVIVTTAVVWNDISPRFTAIDRGAARSDDHIGTGTFDLLFSGEMRADPAGFAFSELQAHFKTTVLHNLSPLCLMVFDYFFLFVSAQEAETDSNDYTISYHSGLFNISPENIEKQSL